MDKIAVLNPSMVDAIYKTPAMQKFLALEAWRAAGEIGLLPLDARLRLRKAASIENRRDRLAAIGEAEAWVKSTYPQFFNQRSE